MTPKQIFARVRMSPEIFDNAQVKYSDYQLIAALNSVLSIVYNSLSSSNTEVLTKRATVALTDGVGDLPEDFLSVVSVFRPSGDVLTPQGKSTDVDAYTYRIRGNKIYSENDTVTVDYKPYFVEIAYDTTGDELDLPNFFMELLKKYCVIVLQGGINKADSTIVQQVTSDVYKLIAGREYSRIETPHDAGSNWAGVI